MLLIISLINPKNNIMITVNYEISDLEQISLKFVTITTTA